MATVQRRHSDSPTPAASAASASAAAAATSSASDDVQVIDVEAHMPKRRRTESSNSSSNALPVIDLTDDSAPAVPVIVDLTSAVTSPPQRPPVRSQIQAARERAASPGHYVLANLYDSDDGGDSDPDDPWSHWNRLRALLPVRLLSTQRSPPSRRRRAPRTPVFPNPIPNLSHAQPSPPAPSPPADAPLPGTASTAASSAGSASASAASSSSPAEQAPAMLTCAVCLDVPTAATAAKCGHIFCEACIKNAIATFKQCPTCRTPLRPNQLQRLYF